MSGPNSLSNIPSKTTGSSSTGNVAFDPRDIQIDPSKYRIGGFVGDLENNNPTTTTAAGTGAGVQAAAANLPTVNINPSTFRIGGFTGGVNTPMVGDVDQIPPGPAVTTASASTEQDQAREQREARFAELLQSGRLGTIKVGDQPTGKRYTLPVEKPK
ncbi:hypothetical protein BGZ98_000181 [Dissophora globulifera]|nr:hypothetical protein BGZ98_000181 [Dissophora globulifera]